MNYLKNKHLSSSALYRTANENAAGTGAGAAYHSDSEMSSGEPSMGFNTTASAGGTTSIGAAGALPADFDRRKRKKLVFCIYM